jgi:hypothetical protein
MMDLSLWSSFPRLAVFYACLLLLVFPVLHLGDRLVKLWRAATRKRSA